LFRCLMVLRKDVPAKLYCVTRCSQPEAFCMRRPSVSKALPVSASHAG
jgi:hypothetical protein